MFVALYAKQECLQQPQSGQGAECIRLVTSYPKANQVERAVGDLACLLDPAGGAGEQSDTAVMLGGVG